ETEVVGRLGDPAEQRLGLLDAAHLGQHVHQPERADDEYALRLMKFRFLRDVSIEEPVVAQLLLKHADSRHHPGIRRRQHLVHRHGERASVQVLWPRAWVKAPISWS